MSQSSAIQVFYVQKNRFSLFMHKGTLNIDNGRVLLASDGGQTVVDVPLSAVGAAFVRGRMGSVFLIVRLHDGQRLYEINTRTGQRLMGKDDRKSDLYGALSEAGIKVLEPGTLFRQF